MRIAVDDEFTREAGRFGLRFTCDDCVHFVPATGTCAHEWPNELHRIRKLGEAREVVFCKEFELL